MITSLSLFAVAQHGEAEALAGRKVSLEQDMETLAAEAADLEILVKALGPDGLTVTFWPASLRASWGG